LGFDIDPEEIEKITNGKTYINYLPDEIVQSAVIDGFVATTVFSRAVEADTFTQLYSTMRN